MQLSASGAAFIKKWEGLRLVPYKDLGGVWTIGWGHELKSGADIPQEITEDQAEDFFTSDTRSLAHELSVVIGNFPLTQNQYDAIFSFSFNLGVSRLITSTLLRQIRSRDMSAAADQFLRWDYCAGRLSQSLLNRRRAERELFMTKAELAQVT